RCRVHHQKEQTRQSRQRHEEDIGEGQGGQGSASAQQPTGRALGQGRGLEQGQGEQQVGVGVTVDVIRTDGGQEERTSSKDAAGKQGGPPTRDRLQRPVQGKDRHVVDRQVQRQVGNCGRKQRVGQPAGDQGGQPCRDVVVGERPQVAGQVQVVAEVDVRVKEESAGQPRAVQGQQE